MANGCESDVVSSVSITNCATDEQRVSSFHCSSVVPTSTKIDGFLRWVGPWWVASMVISKSEKDSRWFQSFCRYFFCKLGYGIANSFEFPPNFASLKFPVLWQVKARVPDSAACFDKKINPS